MHRSPAGLQIPHIAYVKFDFVRHLRHSCLKLVAHIVLLLLVSAEHPDFPDIGTQKPIEHRIPEGTGTAGDHQSLVHEL